MHNNDNNGQITCACGRVTRNMFPTDSGLRGRAREELVSKTIQSPASSVTDL